MYKNDVDIHGVTMLGKLYALESRGMNALAAFVISLFALLVPNLAVAEEYTLDTGDVLRISIFGEAAYPLDTTVDDQGVISLPLLGAVEARGLTPASLAQNIKKEFQSQKLLLDPFVQVTINQHRPFFISGAVAQPGSYPYKPGITIRHALAIAGGFKVANIGNEEPALKIADLRAERAKLLIEEFRHRVRLERFRAESKEQDEFVAPREKPMDISPQFLNEIIDSEQDQLRIGRSSYLSELTHLQVSLDRAKKDAETRSAARKDQENFAKMQLQQLQTSRNLQKKGLVTNTNLLTAERMQNSYLVDIAQASVEEARAKQDILNLENELRAKESARKMNLIMQIQQEQLEIAQVQSSLKFVTDKLLFVSFYGQHRTLDDLRNSVRFVIYRGRGEAAKAIEANEMTEVRADDVIEVSLLTNQDFYGPTPQNQGQ